MNGRPSARWSRIWISAPAATSCSVIVVTVMMVVAVMVMEVAVVVAIPVMVVLHPAAISVPVTDEIALAIVMRSDPTSALIRRPRPIALVPFVMVSHWIPVALDPNKLGARSLRRYRNNARRWRSTNADSDGDLCVSCRHTQSEQEQQKEKWAS